MKKVILLLFASGCLFGNTPYIPHIYESGQISIGDVEINVVVNDQGNLSHLSENDRKVAIEYDPLGNPISFTYNGERTTQFLFEEDQLVGKILPDGRRIQFEALDDDVTIIDNQLIIDGICEITYTEDQIIYKDQQGNEHIHTYEDGYEEMMDGQGCISYGMERSKKGGVDDSLPTNPENDKNWEDVSNKKAQAKGHSTYKNKETGELIRLDKAKPGDYGHKAHDHYHRPNPNKTGDHDACLDAQGRPVPEGSEASHLYPREWKWW